MAAPTCSDQDFADLIERLGPTETARTLGISVRAVMARRRRIEKKLGTLAAPKNRTDRKPRNVNLVEHPQRAMYEVENGIVLVGGDAHYWPNYVSTAHKFFVKTIKDLKPKVVVMNGDVLDGATISRWPRMNWEHRPSLIQEIEVVKERLEEIEQAAKNAKLVWNLGNHDARFETKIANLAPEYEGIEGIHLKDHFPVWRPAWSTWINKGELVIKHRFKGGEFAPKNNTLKSGTNMTTGHLHSQKVYPITDYFQTRYGVDAGCLADPYGPQFNSYSEDNPLDWRSGFACHTFHKGKMLKPTVATVLREGVVDFEGPTELHEI